MSENWAAVLVVAAIIFIPWAMYVGLNHRRY